MSTRTVSQMTAQTVHTADLDSPYVLVDGHRWEISGLGPVFTRDSFPSLVTLGEPDTAHYVTSVWTRLKQDETFTIPGMLLWLRRGEAQRMALVDRDVLLNIEA